MSDVSNYEKLREETKRVYEQVGRIYSPVFKQPVYFSTEGFNHFIYKRPRIEREKIVQITRFSLFSRATQLIGLSTTYQEYEELLKDVEIKMNKQRIWKRTRVQYWGLIAILNRRKIKVIIRKLGENGNMHFWSIIPDWKTSQYRDMRFFITMSGNPEQD